MNIRTSVNNTTKAVLNESLVKKAAKIVLDGEEGLVGPASRVELSVAFVTPRRIQELNKEYRRHDTVTDVLSFSESDGCGGECECDYECGCEGEHDSGPAYLGEIVVCLAQVKRDARESKVTVNYELAWVVVHGILHLLGYDHEKNEAATLQMRAKEEFYLSKLKF